MDYIPKDYWLCMVFFSLFSFSDYDGENNWGKLLCEDTVVRELWLIDQFKLCFWPRNVHPPTLRVSTHLHRCSISAVIYLFFLPPPHLSILSYNPYLFLLSLFILISHLPILPLSSIMDILEIVSSSWWGLCLQSRSGCIDFRTRGVIKAYIIGFGVSLDFLHLFLAPQEVGPSSPVLCCLPCQTGFVDLELKNVWRFIC